MRKITIYLFLFTIPCFSAFANHVPQHIDGDEIDYRYYRNKGVLKYKLPESYIEDKQKLIHLYGYFNSAFTYTQNPLYYEDNLVLNNTNDDNYTMNKLYLVNVLQFTNYTVWDTIFDGTYRDYKQYKTLDDFYFKLQTGPSFLMPDKNTKISAKFLYGDEWSYHRKLFNGFGALIKINHSFFNNFNTTLDTEIEKREYNSNITDETNRYVYSVFLINRLYLNEKHVLRLTPFYRYFNTEKNYQDKDLYGFTFNYTYFPKSIHFYFGLGYEYIKTQYKAPEPSEPYKSKIHEYEYSAFVGYNFIENLSLQLSYAYKKINSNEMDGLMHGRDNSVSLSLVYKFHLI